MDTLLGIGALVGFMIVFDILQNNRKLTIGLLIAGVGALVLHSRFPDIAGVIFGRAVFAGSAALEVALSLFILAAPFLLLWLLFTAALNVLSGGK